MSACELRERFLDVSLSPPELQLFETHLPSCATCQAEVRFFASLTARVQAAVHPSGLPEPTVAKSKVLVRRAHEQSASQRPRWVWGLASVGALATLVALVVWRPGAAESPATRPLELTVIEGAERSVIRPAQVPGKVLEPHQPLTATLGRDRFGLSAGGRSRVLVATAALTRLSLEAGRLAVEVEPRHGSGSFEVEAGDTVVQVVGTRFSVARDARGLQVAVTRGKVLVRRREQSWPVSAGEQLVLGDGAPSVTTSAPEEADELEVVLKGGSPSVRPSASHARPAVTDAGSRVASAMPHDEPLDDVAEPTAAAPTRVAADLNAWRKWVVAGRFDEAQQALGRHLKLHPRDVAAWSLLADLQRKREDFAAAVETSRKIIGLGDRTAANRARFLAASILQDQLGNPTQAATLLEAYLRQGPGLTPLEASAMVRLARARLAQGRRADAERLLQRVVEAHPGTPAATEAEQLLEQQ